MRLILDGLYTTTLRVPVRPETVTCIAYHHLFIGLAVCTLSDSEKGNQAAEKRAKKQQHLFRVPLVFSGHGCCAPFLAYSQAPVIVLLQCRVRRPAYSLTAGKKVTHRENH